MSPPISSDASILDCLRRSGSATVSQLVEQAGVTATAVRGRLTRLMDQGLIAREAVVEGRGRPSHRYRLTEAGVRSAGNNYDDLAKALWEEVRAIEHREIRRGLLGRIAARLSDVYRERIDGETLPDRMKSLVGLMAGREIPMEVRDTDEGPTLTVLACPYPELAEQDRTVCAMERQLFAELVDGPLRLTGCRLDGESCCTFQVSGGPGTSAAAAVS